MGNPTLLMVNGNQFGYSAGHYYYCKYLREHFDIQYICFDRNKKKLELENVQIHYVPFNGNVIKRILRFIFQCIKISKQTKPDILFIVQFNLCQVLALTCKARSKILDIRTGSLALHPLKRKFDNFIIRIQSLFFNKVIILSESLKLKLKLKNKEILILPLGAEPYYEGNHEFLNLHLLYIGSIEQIRNIHQTIEGIGILVQRKPEYIEKIKYTIIGFGSKTDIYKLNNTIEKFNLQNNVFFEGIKTYEELTPYFKKCNIGVTYIPVTDFYNCQPATKLYEYILSGLYTIATNTDENKLVISDTNGILCDDTPESFALAIENVNLKKDFLKDFEIRDSLKNNKWSVLVSDVLFPFLNKNLYQ